MRVGSRPRGVSFLGFVVIVCGLIAAIVMGVLTPAKPVVVETEDSFTAAVTLLVNLPPESGAELDPATSQASQATLARYALLLTTGEIPQRVAATLGYEGDAAQFASGLEVVAQPIALALTVSTTSPDPAQALEVVRAVEEEAVRTLGKGAAAAEGPTVSVLEEAAVLPGQVGGGFVAPPGKPARVVIAALLGMLLGLALAMTTRHFDTLLRTRDDVHAALGAPVLAVVPRPGRAGLARSGIGAADEPSGPEADAYRAVRAALVQGLIPARLGRGARVPRTGEGSLAASGGGVVLVTSAYGGEGKTMVAANLAASFAESGRSVLVIDMDLRSPHAHEALDVPLAAGVSDVVADPSGPALATLVRASRVPGVAVITAGTLRHSLAALGGRTGPVLEDARQLADVVIIDSPPLLERADTFELAPLVDAVVVVVRSGRVDVTAGGRMAEMLARYQAPVAGAVLVADRRARNRRAAAPEGGPPPSRTVTAATATPAWTWRGASPRWRRSWVLVPGVLGLSAYLVVLARAFDTQSYNVWGGMVVIPVVVAVNVALIRHVGRRAPNPWLTKILALGFAAKMLGTLARYAVAYVVYGGAADALRYNAYAAAYYPLWRQGVVEWEWGGKQGTQYMELITTALYVVIGPSPLAAFFVYSSAAFWGCYLMLRAVQVAMPDGDHRRYALLVFLLPSMLYWPSSIGKESWLLFFLGVTSLGAAKFFARQSGAMVLLLTGAAGMVLIRPHIAVLLFAALTIAQLFRPAAAHATGVLAKVGGLVVVGAAAAVLTTQSSGFLGIDDFSWQAVSESVDSASGQASQGGSAFSPVALTSPVGVPAAVVTVLFRPFPWEAGNAQMLVQSLEGLFLAALCVASWPRLRRLPAQMRRNPFLVFAVSYVVAFIVAFSGFGNFGILARQRVLMLPLFLVLLALPAIGESAGLRELGDDDARGNGRKGGGRVGHQDGATVVAAGHGEREPQTAVRAHRRG